MSIQKGERAGERRVAIVTGGARGIGRGIALRLAEDGVDIAIADLPATRTESDGVAEEIRAAGRRGPLVDEKLAEQMGPQKGEALAKYSELITAGRVETPEDVACFVSYLASRDADYMTGQSVMIDGGIVFT